VVGDVARREHAPDVRRCRAGLHLEVAGLVVIELVEEEPRVRVVPDRDEEPVGRDLRLLARVHVLDADCADLAVVAEHLVDDGVRDPLDPRIRPSAVEHDRRGSKLVAAVDDRHFVGELREEDGLLHRGVAAAHDDDVLAAEEGRVADCAVRDAAPLEHPLGFEPELARACARGDDHRSREVLVVADLDAKRPLREVDGGHVVRDELCTEALGLAPEVLHHRGAKHAFRVAGVVLDVARDHQLPPEGDSLDHERVQVCARSVKGGRVPGRSTADDDQVTHVVHRHLFQRFGTHGVHQVIQRIGPLETSLIGWPHRYRIPSRISTAE
jgi:hypothetical protein